MFSQKQIEELAKQQAQSEIEGAESGTINSVLGLDSSGKLVKGAVSGGGTQLYKHVVTLDADIEEEEPLEVTLEFISLTNTSFANKDVYEINGLFISGVYLYFDEGYWRLPVLYIDLANNAIKYYDAYGNVEVFYPYNNSPFKTDTVTTL